MQTASGVPLAVFAGFSLSEVTELTARLKKAGLQHKFLLLFRPFGKEQVGYTVKYAKDLLHETLKKIMSCEAKKTNEIYPGNVLLIYASGKDEHLLYPYIYKIFRIAFFPRGAQGEMNLGDIIFKLQDKEFVSVHHIGRSDCRLLPFRNFYIERSKTIEAKCLSNTNFMIEKGALSITKFGESHTAKRAFKDARDFLYETSKDNHSDVDTYSEKELKTILRYLESKFRFGCPIPEKHHYHVTKENGRLKGTQFTCTRSEEGIFTCQKRHDYLNVGSNDAVRE